MFLCTFTLIYSKHFGSKGWYKNVWNSETIWLRRVLLLFWTNDYPLFLSHEIMIMSGNNNTNNFIFINVGEICRLATASRYYVRILLRNNLKLWIHPKILSKLGFQLSTQLICQGWNPKLFNQSNLILHSIKKPSIFTPFF
jgi:hypothetical protein